MGISILSSLRSELSLIEMSIDKPKLPKLYEGGNQKEGQEQKLNLSPALQAYFDDIGREKTIELLSRFAENDSLGMLRDYIEQGNTAYVFHLLQTAEYGDEWTEMALDMTGFDDQKRQVAGEKFMQATAEVMGTMAKYEHLDPSLSGAQTAADILSETQKG